MKYLKWHGAIDDGHFSYYDKDKGENVKFKIEDWFNINNVSYTVKGWNDKSNSAIYSNDIKNFKDETLTVRDKDWTIYEWTYNKETIEKNGGKIHIKAECIQWGEEFTIYLKGKNFFNLSELIKANPIDSNSYKLAEVNDDKIGAVKFKYPVFASAWAKQTVNEIKTEHIPF